MPVVVVKERISAGGRVAPPFVLLWSAKEPLAVLATAGIENERINTGGRVVTPGCVEKERLKTVGRVVAAG